MRLEEEKEDAEHEKKNEPGGGNKTSPPSHLYLILVAWVAGGSRSGSRGWSRGGSWAGCRAGHGAATQTEAIIATTKTSTIIRTTESHFSNAAKNRARPLDPLTQTLHSIYFSWAANL